MFICNEKRNTIFNRLKLYNFSAEPIKANKYIIPIVGNCLLCSQKHVQILH